MNHGSLHSNRMSALYRYLRENPAGVTGLDIMHEIGALNPATEVSALRHALDKAGEPWTVAPAELVSVSRETGAKTYRYRLVTETWTTETNPSLAGVAS